MGRKFSRLFRRFAMVVYGLTLPLCLLVLFVGVAGGDAEGQHQLNWGLILGSILAMAVLVWRLRLNRRALGDPAAVPTVRRLLLVFMPLGIVAVAGVLVAATGVVWVALGIWLVADPQNGQSLLYMPAVTFDARISGLVLVFIGLVCVAIGALLSLFFLRLFRRRKPEITSPDNATDLEAGHD